MAQYSKSLPRKGLINVNGHYYNPALRYRPLQNTIERAGLDHILVWSRGQQSESSGRRVHTEPLFKLSIITTTIAR